jgi:hypothetical protein
MAIITGAMNYSHRRIVGGDNRVNFPLRISRGIYFGRLKQLNHQKGKQKRDP